MRWNHRNVKVDSEDILNEVMTSMKKHGFINYYGAGHISLIQYQFIE
jgi:hypothetical protein